jgi:hypothetical protein
MELKLDQFMKTPKAAALPLTRGPGPTSHAPWASVSGCKEGEPPRLFTPAKTDGSISDAGAQAHESSSLGAGSWV